MDDILVHTSKEEERLLIRDEEVEATPTSPPSVQGRGLSPRAAGVNPHRMYSSVVLGLLSILTLTTTTAACAPGTPNGTTNRPGGPESVVWGVAGPTYAGTGWVETASLSYWLILLLIPVITKLTT